MANFPLRVAEQSCKCIMRALSFNTMGKRHKKKRAIVCGILVVVMYQLYTMVTMPVRFLFINENSDKQCIIPDLDPFDKSIMKYVWSPDPITCDPLPDLVVIDKQGILHFNKSAFKYYGSDLFTCSYFLLRRDDKNDDGVSFGPEVSLKPPIQIPADFFKLQCRNSDGKTVYDTFHESVYSKNVLAEKHIEQEADPQFSVFMFGIDSTSRLAAIRKLPKTFKYVTEELGGIVYKGYMKVGDNTFPNLVPILTGKQPWTKDLKTDAHNKFNLDEIPFIWRNFSKANYATFYAEDYPEMATFNSIDTYGFTDPPTDHYMRPWMLGMRKVGLASAVLKTVLLPLEYNNKINLKTTSSLCFGNKPIHNYVISYYKRFITQYKNKLRFSLSWLVQICHEFVNYLELGDEDFYEFFKFLKDEGHLDNAFLIFFSDHGSRIDDIRNTFVGRVEERMPLLTIVPPKVFRSKYEDLTKNLQVNSGRLTSNFDLHETLSDILKGDFDKGHLFFKRDTKTRGISLFDTIPEIRSCADASIPEHFCACYGSANIETSNPIVVKAAQTAVVELNTLLKSYKHICADLSLLKIHESQLVSLGLSAQGEEENRWTIYKFFSKPEVEKHKRYVVIFETVPGNAMFEATIDYHIDNGMRVIDEISRTNKYGNTSKCVPEKRLHKYCYCKSLLNN